VKPMPASAGVSSKESVIMTFACTTSIVHCPDVCVCHFCCETNASFCRRVIQRERYPYFCVYHSCATLTSVCATPALKPVPASPGVSSKESATLTSAYAKSVLKPVLASAGVSTIATATLTCRCVTPVLKGVLASADMSPKERTLLATAGLSCTYIAVSPSAGVSSKVGALSRTIE